MRIKAVGDTPPYCCPLTLNPPPIRMLNDIQRGGVVRALATGAAAALSLSLLYQSLPKSSPPPPLKKVQSAGDLTSENNPEGVKSEAGPEPDAIWFGGGSWASALHAGVLTGLREQFGGETVNNWKAGGASAGAAVAVGMLLACTLLVNSPVSQIT